MSRCIIYCIYFFLHEDCSVELVNRSSFFEQVEPCIVFLLCSWENRSQFRLAHEYGSKSKSLTKIDVKKGVFVSKNVKVDLRLPLCAEL